MTDLDPWARPLPEDPADRDTVEDLSLWRLLDGVDGEVSASFRALLHRTIFDERMLALDLKTRFLVLVAVTTAARDDREGIEWSSQLAMKHGASEREVLEAISLTNHPIGTPAMQYAARTYFEQKAGRATVVQWGDPSRARPFSAWDRWRRERRP